MRNPHVQPIDPARRVPPVRRRAVGASLALAALTLASGAGAAPTPIDQQRFRVRVLESKVVELTKRVATAQTAYVRSRDRLVTLRERIRRNTADLAKLRTQHAEAQRRLARRASAIYRNRQPSAFETFLTSQSLTRVLDSNRTQRWVVTRDADDVRVLARTRDRIATVRTRLISDRGEARVRFRETRSRFKQLSTARLQEARLLSGARAQLAAFIAEEIRRQRVIAQARAAAAARARTIRVTPASPGQTRLPDVPAPVATAPSSGGTVSVSGGVLDRIAQCESGGNPSAVSPNGQFRGKYQFDPSTWERLGGSGDPAAAPEAEQDRLAAKLYAQAGAAPWPVCGRVTS